MSKSSWKLKIEEIAKRDRMEKKKEEELVKLIDEARIAELKQEILKTEIMRFEFELLKSKTTKKINQPEETTNSWKDLDINDLSTFPKDFFTNEYYDIENSWKNGEWLQSDNIDINDRWEIIKNIKTDILFKYRYRLKPLEPMKVDKDIAIELFGMNEDYKESWFVYRGRKVEII